VFWRLISLARECKDYEVQAKAMLNYAGIALDCWHLAIAESYLDKTSGLLASASRPAGDELVLRARADLAARTLDVSRLKTAIAESGDLTADDSSEILDYHCLLAAVQGAEWPEKELWEHQGKASTGDVTRLLHKTRALKKRLTAHSLGRALRLSQHELSTRKGFEWIVAHYANGVTNPEVSIALGWQFLAKPEYREGHDDLQIELRARMARLLLASGRQREAWGLLEDALFRFRKLESKVERWGRPQGVLDRLHRLLCAAMGIENRASLGSAHRRSSVLQAEAFRAVMTRGVSALAAPRNSSHEMLMRLAKTVGAVTEPDDLVDALLDLALASSGAQRAVLVTVEHGERYVRGHKLASGTSERADEGDLSWAIVSKVLSSGEAEVYGDALAAEQLASHRSVALLNLRSLACVPLIAPDGVMGVLYLDHQGVAGLFGEELLGFLSLLANVMATSLSALEISREVEASKSKLAEAHQQLVRSERNRLAGQIAGGIAHDIKNVLATIVARCQLTRQAQDAVEVAKPLRAIEEAAHSAATMLEKLQECSREHLLQKEEPTDLSTVAAEAVELLTPRFASSKGSGADAIRVDVDAQSGVITDCVPGEVRELFLNLMVNACDAMADGGTLSISVKGDPREGEAIIKVSDTGTGMSEEVRERIFEPFFTTKGRQGTGLGLAVVKNVVLRYAGSISVESCEGVGTTITVNFPMAARRVGSGIGGRAGRSRVPSRSLRERPGS
jgi:signal transduction histidine kinase